MRQKKRWIYYHDPLVDWLLYGTRYNWYATTYFLFGEKITIELGAPL